MKFAVIVKSFLVGGIPVYIFLDVVTTKFKLKSSVTSSISPVPSRLFL